jgi:hypothetical protein
LRGGDGRCERRQTKCRCGAHAVNVMIVCAGEWPGLCRRCSQRGWEAADK